MTARRTPTVPPAAGRVVTRVLRRFVLRPDVPWATQRQRLHRFTESAPTPPGATVTRAEVGGVSCEWVRGPGVADDPAGRVLVHLHGGGYCVGTPGMMRVWAVAVSTATGGAVLLPDYRLAPEHPFPAARDDTLAVWDALTTEAGHDPSTLCLSGDSAGAGLALSAVMHLRQAGRPLPGALVLVSPWLDLTDDRLGDPALRARDTLLTPAWLSAAATAYGGDTALDDPGVSPLRGDLRDLPPVLIQAGADDLLLPDSLRLAAAVRHAGGEVVMSVGNDLWHDFPTQAGVLAAADSAVRQVAAFVARTIPDPDPDPR